MSLRSAFSASRPRAGTAMLESGLCFLMLMTIFMAIIEFGMGIYVFNFVSYAAREGSRYASTHGSLSGMSQSTAETNIRDNIVRPQAVALDSSQVSVTTTWNPDNTPGNTVTVNVSYPITPVLGFVLGNITVGATSTMMIAQ